ncbi:MAG: hypothetical protein ACOX4D_04025 [Bacteroidales bacterium]
MASRKIRDGFSKILGWLPENSEMASRKNVVYISISELYVWDGIPRNLRWLP